MVEQEVERLERQLDMIGAAVRVGVSNVRQVATERRQVEHDLRQARRADAELCSQVGVGRVDGSPPKFTPKSLVLARVK